MNNKIKVGFTTQNATGFGFSTLDAAWKKKKLSQPSFTHLQKREKNTVLRGTAPVDYTDGIQ